MINITIVGVGALGSNLVPIIRNEAIVKVIDYDKVEKRNVLSQFHGNSSVGKNKAKALQQSMNFFFGKKIEAIPFKLTNDNVNELLINSNIIIDCLDNAESRQIVQNYVREHDVPCLHGALAADGGFGRVVWDESFTIDSEGSEGAPTCEGGEHLPFIVTVSSYLARAIQTFVKDGSKDAYQITPRGVFLC